MREIRVTLPPSDLHPDPVRYFPAKTHTYLVGTSGVLTIKERVGQVEPLPGGKPSPPQPLFDTVVQYSPTGWLSVEEIR